MLDVNGVPRYLACACIGRVLVEAIRVPSCCSYRRHMTIALLRDKISVCSILDILCYSYSAENVTDIQLSICFLRSSHWQPCLLSCSEK